MIFPALVMGYTNHLLLSVNELSVRTWHRNFIFILRDKTQLDWALLYCEDPLNVVLYNPVFKEIRDKSEHPKGGDDNLKILIYGNCGKIYLLSPQKKENKE